MFDVAGVIVGLIIGFALLVIGGVITPKTLKDENRETAKFAFMVVGAAILILFIVLGVYEGAGKPIPFPAKPGYYRFYLVEKNMNEITGIIAEAAKDGNESVKKFVVIPKKAISNDELLENHKISGLKVIEEVKGYKKIILIP